MGVNLLLLPLGLREYPFDSFPSTGLHIYYYTDGSSLQR